MQNNWKESGKTNFEKIKLKIDPYKGVSIDRQEMSGAVHQSLHHSGSQEFKPFGTAGDCYSWNECGDARKGEFMIDKGDKKS